MVARAAWQQPRCFRVDASIDPYTVGADSISARKLCDCRYVLRASIVRPHILCIHFIS